MLSLLHFAFSDGFLTFGCLSIVPGIAGHTGNDYIKNFVHYCKEDGFNVVSYNWPGCGEHDLTVRGGIGAKMSPTCGGDTWSTWN